MHADSAPAITHSHSRHAAGSAHLSIASSASCLLFGSKSHYKKVFERAQQQGWVNPQSKHRRDEDALESMVSQEDEPQPVDFSSVAITTDGHPFKIEQLVPERYGTLLSGHGGAGKSQVAILISLHLATGKPLQGKAVKTSKVLYLSCEDDATVIVNRMHRMSTEMGITLTDLSDKLFVYDLTDFDATLFGKVGPYGKTSFTNRYAWLAKVVKQHQIDVLVVDNASDTFDGNEIARAEVRSYINGLSRLVRKSNGAVILISHVNKVTASSHLPNTEAYSGSTAWHNSVRSRLYLERKENQLTLNPQKSNYSGMSEQLTFEMHDGIVRLPLDPLLNRLVDDEIDFQSHTPIILQILRDLQKTGVFVSPEHNGNKNAFKLMEKDLRFPDINREELQFAIDRLIQAGTIEEFEYRKDGKPRKGLRVID